MIARHSERAWLRMLLVAAVLSSLFSPAAYAQASDLARQVEIRRTRYGVPHIRAQNLRAAGFGMGYVQTEDYGERVIRGLIGARGELGRAFGADAMQPDFLARLEHARAVETYHRLDADVRAVLEGFAEGVNHYIRVQRASRPEWAQPVFTGHDVAARDIGSAGGAQRFLQRIRGTPGGPLTESGAVDKDVGSPLSARRGATLRR